MLRLCLILLCIIIPVGALAQSKLVICSDNNFWYPFTLVEDGQATGIHIEIIATALNSLGYAFELRPLPWKRCLNEAKNGGVDAVATASYKAERADFMHYPADAATASKSTLRVMQVEYVVVTSAFNAYEFNGDAHSIPTPIRAPRGYSIADDLRNWGLTVDDNASGDENNLKKLLRTNKGSVITTPNLIHLLSETPEYHGRLKISTQPLKSKSYFLPISKASKLTAEERTRIWSAIATLRDNKDFMAKLSTKY